MRASVRNSVTDELATGAGASFAALRAPAARRRWREQHERRPAELAAGLPVGTTAVPITNSSITSPVCERRVADVPRVRAPRVLLLGDRHADDAGRARAPRPRPAGARSRARARRRARACTRDSSQLCVAGACEERAAARSRRSCPSRSRPAGSPVRISIQKSWPERSDWNGLPLLVAGSCSPPRWRTAVPIAMNSAVFWPSA